jgi:hypothetical protein
VCQQNTSAESTGTAAASEPERGQVALDRVRRICPARRGVQLRDACVSSAGRVDRRRRRTMRPLGRVVVTLTTALICFISYTPQIFIIWPWYGRELSMELLALLVPFKYVLIFALCCSIHETFCKSISVGILLYNYYLCITTDPGGVPKGWVRHEPTLMTMTLSAYSRSFRRQNSMTKKATKLRSFLETQDIVACAEDTNHHAHITARRVKSGFP